VSEQTTITWEDYARAESFLPWNVTKRAFKLSVTPHWIDGSDRFWYLNRTRDGAEFVLVDPARASRDPAFDHARLAAALSAAAGTFYEPGKLPFESIEFVDDGRAVRFETVDARWDCDLTSYACTRGDKRPDFAEAELLSPDGKTAAFVRASNLWLRDVESGAERQLTTDGEPNHAWATQPEAALTTVTDRLTGRKVPVCALWSPDSTRIVTHRIDERSVENMYLLQALPQDGGMRPVLHAYRYPLPGDEHIAMAEFWVFDAAAGSATRVDMPPTMAPTFSPFDRNDVAWTKGGSRLAIVTHERGYHASALVIADADSGAVVTAVEERGPTFTSPSLSPVSDKPMVYSSDDGSDVLWFSERDGWGHLYLYDPATGQPKRQITSGAWVVREVCHIDDASRTIFFTGGGKESERDPYLRHLYRTGLDGGEPQLLTPEDADHQITFSPSGAYFVDVEGMATHGEMHIRADGYVGIAPLPGGVTNVCVVRDLKNMFRAQRVNADGLIAVAVSDDPMLRDRFVRARRVSDVTSLGPLAVDAVTAGYPGLLLAGDAAGFIDPMTGDGLRFALRGGELAAEAALRELSSGSPACDSLWAARAREFGSKWRINRGLRTLVNSPRAVGAAARVAQQWSAPVRLLVRVAGDLNLVPDVAS
jgi:Tol biopolymer transport system component